MSARAGNRMPRSSTPVMVKTRSLNFTVAPIAFGSALNRARQKASVITTAGGPPAFCSSSESSRPIAARAPSASKNPGVIRNTET